MKRRMILSAFILAIAVASAVAGDKKITIEDALAIKNVGQPQFSPDGRWIAFTISEWNRKEDRRDSHIYLISASGGQPIKLTNGERGESSPQWSPDGSRIAFLASRDSSPPGTTGPRGNQIWIISVRGGEAERITSEDAGVAQFRWSHDGKQIAFVTRDTPKDNAEREKRKKDKFYAIV
ncbi:MAG TPA: hypothetical protein VID27_06410, partial [Blastocatellia bacterium]